MANRISIEQSTTARHPALPIAILVLLAVLPYLNSLWGEFHFDDTHSIVENTRIRAWPDVMGERLPRLLTSLTFFVDYKLGGLDNMPVWHATNIALHACCVLAFYWAITLLIRGASWHERPGERTSRSQQPSSVSDAPAWPRHVPFLAAAIFAVHPLASEPVNYIQARAVILYSIFSWLALCGAAIAHQSFRGMGVPPMSSNVADVPSARAWGDRRPGRSRVAGAALCVSSVLLAAISKEVGVFFALAMVAVYAWAVAAPRAGNKKRFWIASGASVAIALAGAACWLRTGNVWRDMARRLNGDLWSHFWAQVTIFWRYVGLAAWPAPSALNVDHYIHPYVVVHLLPYGHSSSVEQYAITDAAVAASLAALALLVLAPAIWLIVRKSWLALPLLMLPIGIAPYFFLPSAEMMVEYRFYLSLACVCVLAAVALSAGLALWHPDGRPARGNPASARAPRGASVLLAAAIVCVPLGAATAWRNADWRTDLALWEDAAAKVPHKARTVNALALALVRDKEHPDPPRALALADRSFDSNYVDTWGDDPSIVGNPFMRDTQAEVYCAYAKWCAAQAKPDLPKARRYFDDAIFKESLALKVAQHATDQTAGDPAFYQRQLQTFRAAKERVFGQDPTTRPASTAH
jgi:hypothetical protein